MCRSVPGPAYDPALVVLFSDSKKAGSGVTEEIVHLKPRKSTSYRFRNNAALQIDQPKRES